MDKKLFELKYPFEYRGAKYTQFEARRPKLRDLKQFLKDLDKDSMAALQRVLSDLFEVQIEVMENIDIEDFGPMKSWFEDFLKHMAPESNP